MHAARALVLHNSGVGVLLSSMLASICYGVMRPVLNPGDASGTCPLASDLTATQTLPQNSSNNSLKVTMV